MKQCFAGITGDKQDPSGIRPPKQTESMDYDLSNTFDQLNKKLAVLPDLLASLIRLDLLVTMERRRIEHAHSATQALPTSRLP